MVVYLPKEKLRFEPGRNKCAICQGVHLLSYLAVSAFTTADGDQVGLNIQLGDFICIQNAVFDKGIAAGTGDAGKFRVFQRSENCALRYAHIDKVPSGLVLKLFTSLRPQSQGVISGSTLFQHFHDAFTSCSDSGNGLKFPASSKALKLVNGRKRVLTAAAVFDVFAFHHIPEQRQKRPTRRPCA